MPNSSDKKKASQRPKTIITDAEFDMDHIPTLMITEFRKLDFRGKIEVMRMLTDSLKEHYDIEAKKTAEYMGYLKEASAAFLILRN